MTPSDSQGVAQEKRCTRVREGYFHAPGKEWCLGWCLHFRTLQLGEDGTFTTTLRPRKRLIQRGACTWSTHARRHSSIGGARFIAHPVLFGQSTDEWVWRSSVSWILLLEGPEAGFAYLRVCCLGGHFGCAGGTEGT